MTKYILLIDPDPDQHEFFRWTIEKLNSGFRLLSAYTATEGIKIFRKVKPQISFVNFELDDMPGLLCLKKIKSIRGAGKIPVYIYSHRPNEAVAKKASAYGAAGCLDEMNEQSGLNRCLFKVLRDGDSKSW